MQNSESKTYSVQFSGQSGEYFRIWIVNVLLSVITLGIYSAWAKVRNKQYFYGNTAIDEHRFDYHALPMQILKGRIIAFICLLVWTVANTFFPVVASVMMLAFAAIVPLLVRNNLRFDAAMTSYRNVRFSFSGELKEAYFAYLGRPVVVFIMLFLLIVLAVTTLSANPVVGGITGLLAAFLGLLAYGWVAVGMTRYQIDYLHYGEHDFGCDLQAGFFAKTYLLAALAGALIITVIGAVVSLFAWPVIEGLLAGQEPDAATITLFVAVSYGSMFLFGLVTAALVRVRIRNYVFSHSFIELKGEESQQMPLELDSEMTVSSYLWLVVSNFFAQLITLGLARPWVMVRTQAYLASVTSVTGDLSQLTATAQEDGVKSALGDEMAQAFDLEFGL